MASELPEGKEYTVDHSGQDAIVCGSAPCLPEEYKRASFHMPDAKVFVVNEASWGIWGDFLVSYHAEKFDVFKEKSVNPNIPTLTGKGYRSPEEDRQVDYRFSNIRIGATSVGDALQIAAQMGFGRIVLVGAPMNGCDGYYNKTTTSEGYFSPRFGSKNQGESQQVRLNKAKLASIAPDFPMVRSMSGFTQEVFGAPDWS